MNSPIKYLIRGIFKKAKEESGIKSTYGCCNYLEEKFREDFKCYDGTSSRSFARLHDKYVEESRPENATPKPGLLDAMSQYLGFEDYQSFIVSQGNNKESSTTKSTSKRPERIIIALLLLVICLIVIYSIVSGPGVRTPECMVWNHVHYQKISCELNLHMDRAGEIIEFDKKLYNHLKMIPAQDAKVGSSYYYKVSSDSLQFFSWYGKHPVNGADLK